MRGSVTPRRRRSIRKTMPAAASPSATKNSWVPSGGSQGARSCRVGNTAQPAVQPNTRAHTITQSGVAAAARAATTHR